MHSPNTRSARVRQDILVLVVDALRAWSRGGDIAAAEIRDMIDARLDEEFTAAIQQALSDIRPNDE
jgi:hypothetical protein